MAVSSDALGAVLRVLLRYSLRAILVVSPPPFLLDEQWSVDRAMTGKRFANEIETDIGDFLRDLDRIFQIAIQCLDRQGSFEEHLGGETLPIYVKSSERRVLYFNQAYQLVFASEQVPTGRLSNAFLQDTVVPISTASDDLILSGCSSAVFDHFGHDTLGKPVMFRTGKRSLRAMGQPSFAILGVSQVIELLPEEAGREAKAALMTQKWNRFSRLPNDDRSLAILLAKGMTPNDIAEQRLVSKRTIENHRVRILHDLELDNQVDLIKLLVRLQEKGFGDFGV